MSRPRTTPDDQGTPSLLASLRSRANGVLLVSRHRDGSEVVFCGEVAGEYVGWTPREDADAKGYSYIGLPDEEIAALLALYEDAISGLRYIEQRYGRLDGVGWDRVLGALES